MSPASTAALSVMCWLGIETKGLVWNAVLFPNKMYVTKHKLLVTMEFRGIKMRK